ncbi:MAG: TrkA family potassium uptake protein [Candidatus Zixiibacteriota bacterium]|nr:MAG: TrkA family potassium uptake protein [candidate division Zixibacteria bacterium]HDL03467.1 TrkA family potassium uptake protein [candidate division Zixibacteria bacterium]
MKKFAVIGLGNFGANVAIELSKLDCKVTAIDIDKNKVQSLQDFAEMAIIADVSERSFLENLGVDNYDCFIVSTGKDSHASILIALYLKELGAAQIIVKANSEDHARILYKVGATEAIIPEKQMALKLSHSLARQNLIDQLPLTGEYYVAEIAPPDDFINKRLMELQLRTKYHVQVIALKDSITGEFEFAPGGEYTIKKNDILVVLGKEQDIVGFKE